MSYAYRSRSRSFSNRSSSNNRSRSNNSRKHGQYIDPSRFVKAATAATEEVYVPTHSFTDFNLNPLLQRNLDGMDYETPSPIQDQTIPEALSGRDIIGIASTGTGKTAAFALPILQRLLDEQYGTALIIAPTRELAQQIDDAFRAIAKGSGLTGAVLIGGTGMGGQLRDLRNRPRIIIGTPGRIKDHLERRTLKLDNCTMIVLDEVDRMLDMGFTPDVTYILQHAAEKRQSFFFSATMEPRVRNLIDNFSVNPFTVSLKASSTSDNVHQDVVRYRDNSEKMDKLHDLLISEKVSKAIVFDDTQRSVERLSKDLLSRGFSTDAIHGGKTQGQRQRALNRIKQNDITILVATDVAARGIDVADISHVINYSVPKVYDDYIHRVGRAGRAGQIGYALTFVAH
jgi:superfamily II DNA/RNA helicase